MKPLFIKEVGLKFYGGRKRMFAIYRCSYCDSFFESSKESIDSGNKKSCGCMTNALKIRITHNSSKTKLYKVWASMKQRCFNVKNKKYKTYGARGITVCDEWKKFEPFQKWALSNGYSQGLSIDRRDNDGNYEPSNCRWVGVKIQSSNRRTTNKTGFIGVSLERNRYVAHLSIENKKKHIGSFNTAIDAAKARDNFIVENNLHHKLNLKEN